MTNTEMLIGLGSLGLGAYLGNKALKESRRGLGAALTTGPGLLGAGALVLGALTLTGKVNPQHFIGPRATVYF